MILLCSTLSLVSLAGARNERLLFSYKDAFDSDDFKARFGSQVRFVFGGKPKEAIARTFGEFKTSRKVNAFAKSDKVACREALMNALIILKARAMKEGGNAVINVYSNYRNNRLDSDSLYECGAGAMVAGVALVGEIVQLGAGNPTDSIPKSATAPKEI
jgi:hypothetical protein